MEYQLGPQNASPAQVSVAPDSDTARTWRAWRRGAFYALSAVCVFGGLNGVRVQEDPGMRLAAGALIPLGLPGMVMLGIKVILRVRAACRMRRGRCMGCGYSVAEMSSAVCPECGRDPFEPP
jgi:hypothetical protein